MRKSVLFVGFLLAFSSGLTAQAKKPVQTVSIQTPGAQCEACKQRIEEYLKREPGILKVNVDFKKKITKVSFYTERTNIENIRAAISNVGFDADSLAANPDSYRELPRCCQNKSSSGVSPGNH